MNCPYDMRTNRPFSLRTATVSVICALASLVSAAPLDAQTPPAADPAPAAAIPLSLEALDWVAGCWLGDVVGREFREQWMPLRGGMIIGVSQTVMQGKTQDFEYLRLDARPDGVWYVAITSGKTETAFKLTAIAPEGADTVFTFTNPLDQFPQRILYRRNPKGWLYAQVEGKLNGQDKQVIYPMQRIDCQSGELIRK